MRGTAFIKKISIVFSIVCVVLISALTAAGVFTGQNEDKPDIRPEMPGYVEGEVLVIFKKGVDIITAESLADSLSIDVKKHFRAISRIKGQVYMHLKSGFKTTQQIQAELAKRTEVEDVSPNHILYADDTTPNDPRFNELWGLHNTGQNGGTQDIDINAPEAWDKTTGSPDVIAAVIDSGIDYNHPELAPNIWVNPNEIEDGVDNDGNGYIDDIHGINAITGSGDPLDDNGHGTHCSGTIGAAGNNGLGVAGVNWNVKLMGTKFLNSSGSGATSNSIACIDYIIDQKTTYGQNIVSINASYGGGSYNQSVKDAIDAAGDAGIIFCASAGNNYTDNDTYPHYPSSYTCSNIISVTAVDYNGTQYYNYGALSVDIAAPGRSILSTIQCVYTPQPGDIFFDNMENGTGLWTHGGTPNSWDITNAASGGLENYWNDMAYGNFWSDSPGTGYGHDVDNWLAAAGDIDLSPYTGQTVFLAFDGGFQMDYFVTNDTASVLVSNNSGVNWGTLADLKTIYYGYGYYYKKQVYVIPETYKTQNFRFLFQTTSDNTDYSYYGYRNKGWIIDNIGIGTQLSCGYEYKNGTSMATPHVTGAAALIAAYYPSDTAAERIARLLENTLPLPSLTGKCVTGGLLDLDSAIGVSIPTITVTSPNGGETWGVGVSHPITWTAAGVVGNLKLEYSVNNGSSWMEIVASTPNDGGYDWTIPDNPSESCLVKVSEIDGPLSDRSDGVFLISVLPTITVISPNGGELLEAGTTHNITWTSTGTVGNVKIEYSTPGRPWADIIASTPNDGKYRWAVPETASESFSIRVSETDGEPSDVSDGVFTVFIPPSFTVTSPNGGEYWEAGTTHSITWTDRETSGYTRIKYSTDNGGSWKFIIPYTINDGEYNWTVPNEPSGTCLIRVSETDEDPWDVSDAVFTIYTGSAITVTSPNGGENWMAGSSHDITWTTAGTVGNVDIQYSTDNGNAWTGIAASTANDGIHNWTVPDTPAAQCLVRVAETGGGPSDTGNAVFSICSQPVITVTSPNGGENWRTGSSHLITWTGTETVGNVKIELSIDNGGQWRTIAESTDNDGSFSWTVLDTPSDQCLVRVGETDGSPSDVGNAVFSIILPPSITVTSPNGGESWQAGSSHDITWTSTGTVGKVNIQYTVDNGGTWTDIAVSTPNDGSYHWTVPETPSTQCLVRVSQGGGSPSDTGNAVFSIVTEPENTITLTSPNGGENIEVGTSHYIAWTTTGTVGNLFIKYSTDGGNSWATIVESTENNGGYNWTVPHTPSDNCLVRIVEKEKDTPVDTSDAVFSIITPTIVVTSPNGGEQLTVGSNHQITWTTLGTVNHVTIDYSTNGGNSWKSIAQSVENNGGYDWTVPGGPSEHCLVRIRESDTDTAALDTSNGEFSIIPQSTPVIAVTYPNGGETLYAGSQREITWTGSPSIDSVAIEYSSDNGAYWTEIIASTPNDGNFQWTVPETPSTKCLIRVSQTNEPSVGDESDGVFIITTQAAPGLTVTSPNGGETVTAGSDFEITWSSTGSIDKVTVDYSVNNGETWSVIVTGTFNDGSFTWTVPGIPSEECLVRVRENEDDTGPRDTSDAVFSIDASSSVLVLSPNGGELLYAGSVFEITWTSIGITGDVRIKYSTDSGSHWTEIVDSTPNDGSYDWTVPDTPSVHCLVRIDDTSGSPSPVYDKSDGVFEITSETAPSLTVISPNGGETLTAGTVHEITWTGTVTGNEIGIDYSTDNGDTWETVEISTPNTGTYNWTVPDTPSAVSDNCLIRITGMDGDTVPLDVSDAVFSIIAAASASLTVTSPNGGETLTVGSNHEITWTGTGEIESVMIEYSPDNGANWIEITVSTPNEGIYEWTVPDNPSDHCLVRIRQDDNDNNPSDTSDTEFAIIPPTGSLTVSSPNGGETFYGSYIHEITWTGSEIIHDVRIEYSTDSGVTWEDVIASTPNDGGYEWTVPEISSETCLIRIGDTAGDASDESDAVFSIIDEGYNCGNQGIAYESGSQLRIAGVEITFLSEDGTRTKRTTTNTSGFYRISLKPQRYWVTAKHPDYNDYSTYPGFSVITGNGYQTANFFLTRK